MGLKKIVLHFIGCCFVLLTVSFDLQMPLTFMESHLLNVYLSAYTIGVLIKGVSSSSAISHFLFYQAWCIQFYVEALIHVDF